MFHSHLKVQSWMEIDQRMVNANQCFCSQYNESILGTNVHRTHVSNLYSHIHIINAQFSMEMFSNVTTKPHRLR